MSNIENSLYTAKAMSIRSCEAFLQDISEKSRDIAWLIYADNRELIDNDAELESDWNKRVARTIKNLAGWCDVAARLAAFQGVDRIHRGDIGV